MKKMYLIAMALTVATAVIFGSLMTPNFFLGAMVSEVKENSKSYAATDEAPSGVQPSISEVQPSIVAIPDSNILPSASPTAAPDSKSSSEPSVSKAEEKVTETVETVIPDPVATLEVIESPAATTEAAPLARISPEAAPDKVKNEEVRYTIQPVPGPHGSVRYAKPPVPTAPTPAPTPTPTPTPAPVPTVSKQDEYKKIVYNTVKNWCPDARITLNDPKVVSGNVYGWAWWDTPTFSIRYEEGMPMAITKSIALHECGHLLQAKAFGTHSGAREQAKKRFQQIYGGTGEQAIEANADCISYYLGPKATPTDVWYQTPVTNWNNECKGSRGDAAIKVINGQKP